MLQEKDYIKAAQDLGIEVATIKAVDEVESGGKGFWSNGQLVILYEPHIFWRQLQAFKISPLQVLKDKPVMKDVLYKKWRTLPYPPTYKRWAQLEKAATVHGEAAYNSASYGRYQIMGFHAKALGYKNSIDFAEQLKKGEDKHLEAFVRFIKATKLQSFLQKKDWAGFALRYNGAGYKANKYDEKLQKAYEKHSKTD